MRSRHRAWAFCLAVLLAAPALAQTPPPSTLKERFRAADKNGDGRIDRDEYYQIIVEGFYFRDKERKGYLVIAQLPESSAEAFKAANRKADGHLTLEEYVNALFKDFEAADLDKDGSLTFEEIEIYVRANRR